MCEALWGKGEMPGVALRAGKNRGYYRGQEHKVVCQFQMPETKDLRLRKERHESGLKLEHELGLKQALGLENQAAEKS